MRLPVLLTLSGLLASHASADIGPPSNYTWQGYGDGDGSGQWSDSTHWENGVLPTNNGLGDIFFPGNFEENSDFLINSVNVDINVDVASLFFDEGADYEFFSWSSGTELRVRDQIRLNSGEYQSNVFFSSDFAVVADGGIEIDVGFGTRLEIDSLFYNGFESVTEILGGGTLLLNGYNAYENLNGVLNVTEGYLGLGNDFAAGDALIEFGDIDNPGSNAVGIIAAYGDRRITNDVVVHGYLEIAHEGTEYHEMGFEAPVIFTADTQLFNNGGVLNFLGGIGESSTDEAFSGASLDIWADQPVIFTGETNITGDIDVQTGAVLFSDLNAIPSDQSGLSIAAVNKDAYVGLMIDSITDRLEATTRFLDLLAPDRFEGTIGFDTDPGNTGTINVYDAPIDLTQLTNARLGSATVAEITGPITPANDTYQFGGGGGTLLVSSPLQDSTPPVAASSAVPVAASAVPRNIAVVSPPSSPLTVYINNSTNSFSGTVTAENSAVVFGDAPGALPSSATLEPSSGGYIGLQDATLSVVSYLSQFDPLLEKGIIGFDSPDRDTNRTVTELIDLTSFTSETPDFYIGSSTSVTLANSIFLPYSATDFRFAGYKGGTLEVATNLFDPEQQVGVVIGDLNSPATHGYTPIDSDDFELSTVRLSGTNSYSGGTRLEAGQLVVTNNNSLGIGTLTVSGETSGGFTEAVSFGLFDEYENDAFDSRAPVLSPGADDLVIANDIEVEGFLEVDVQIGLVDQNLTLAGDISGTGGIDKNGNGTLTLGGENSGFTGGLYLSEGTVNIDSDTGAGSGPVGFGGSSSSQTLNFNTLAPTIGGLYEVNNFADEYYSYSSATVNLLAGSTLTLNLDGYFLDYAGTISGDGAVRITGSGSQVLSGFNSFSGGLEIADGANLVATSTSSLGGAYSEPPSLTLDGGSLTLSGGEESSIEAILSFGPKGGQIRGNGTLSFTDPLAIEEGVNISPGFSVGEIDFGGPLEFGELGSLTVEIGDGENDEIISDVIFAETIDVTATSSSPFSISIVGEDGELPTGFDAMQAYSWSVALAGASITNFDAMAFNLGVSSALQSLGGEGIWTLQLASSGNEFSETFLTDNVLVVNFTPIPEPSTFALMFIGLALLTFRRPRR
jgi:autotransporter-associated beta strand protein